MAVEDLDLALSAACLGEIHGGVGVTQQAFETEIVLIQYCHPDAGSELERAVGDDKGNGEDVHDPLGERQHEVAIAEFVTDDDELVPAESGQRVGLS